jgi:hypothetical protein
MTQNTQIPPDFDLRHFTRAAMDDIVEEPEPGKVWHSVVFERLPVVLRDLVPSDQVELLLNCLWQTGPGIVTEENRRRRNAALIGLPTRPAPSELTSGRGEEGTEDRASKDGIVKAPEPKATGCRPRNRWKEHSAAYRELLERNVVTASGWKALADCTHADLLFAAKDRRQRAASIAHFADIYEHLAQELVRHGVDAVKDLPPESFEPAA